MNSLRQQMPVTERYAYFDHAAVAPLPAAAAGAMADYAWQAAQHGDVHWLEWSAAVARLRETAASLMGAQLEEIALVNNTTQGINLVAEGFPWRSGDNLIVPANEFPSNSLPWRNLERLGVEIRWVAVPPSGQLSMDQFLPLFDARTRMVAVSWVGFASGFRLPVAELVELAHARGSLVFLDAIQGLGAFPLNVGDCGVDFLSADGHKWMLGPEGAGILYVRREHLNLLQPLGLGWGSLAAAAFDPLSIELKPTAGRYEGGAMNMAGMLGFGQSLRLLEECGAGLPSSQVASAILQNVAELEDRLLAHGFQVHLPADPAHRSGIVGFGWPEASEQDYLAARKACHHQGVVLSVRGGRLRASPHAYNNTEDISRLIDALVDFGRSQG